MTLNYYDSLYHLIELSVYKLNNPTEKEPSLKRQLFIRNLIILSNNLISTQPPITEELWLNACFDELDREEDYDMEEEKENDLVVMTIPFDYVIQQEKDQSIRKTTLFLHLK